MRKKSGRKPYKKPAVVFERELEVLAAACGIGSPNLYLGTANCKGDQRCTILYS
jgi:hypothetical protein